MRVLIAEDDRISRRILEAILRKWGYEPLAAEDGNAAWAALQQPDPPKLVLLDWNMPGTDGLGICRRLRQTASSNPSYIILLTGRSDKADTVEALEAGANDYIVKPYDNAELLARIRVGQRMIELQASLLDARNTLEHLATHDCLTGTLNRGAVLERLRSELSRAKREGGELTIGLCDLDHFKKVNDTYGHQAGDDALIAFTQCVQSHLRDYDCLGRYGGEEFVVITPGRIGPSAEDVYERLRAQVAGTTVETKGGPISFTVSIGVASGTGDCTVDDLLGAADAALYEAKAAGRNRVARAPAIGSVKANVKGTGS